MLKTYSLKRIKIGSFPKYSWHVRIYSSTLTLPTSKVFLINSPLGNIIFRKCMHHKNFDKGTMKHTKLCEFRTKIQKQRIRKNMLVYYSLLHEPF